MTESELLDIEQALHSLKPTALSPDLLERTELQLFGASLADIRPQQISEQLIDSTETKILETEFHTLEPRAVDKAFLDQLDLIEAASGFTQFKPAALSSDFLDKLSSSLENVDSTEEVMEENVIQFPSPERKSQKSRKWIASTAIAACVGVFCGLMFTNKSTPTESFVEGSTPTSPLNLSDDNLQKVTYIQAEDQGLVPNKDANQPQFRSMKVIQLETFSVQDANGENIQVQRPVEKTILVPVQAD